MRAKVIKDNSGYVVRLDRGDGVVSNKYYGENRQSAVERANSINAQAVARQKAIEQHAALNPAPEFKAIDRR